MDLLFTQIVTHTHIHTKSHGYTQITKPKFKHGKWECAENKASMFVLPGSNAATGFLMEKHISPVKPGSGPSLSVCGPSLINLFLTGRGCMWEIFFPPRPECSLCWPLWQRGALYLLRMKLLWTKWIKFNLFGIYREFLRIFRQQISFIAQPA